MNLLVLVLVTSTLCVPVPRSKEVLEKFQELHPCPSTGLTYGKCPGYVKDHIIPLCLTGKAGDIVSNIQWQTLKDSRIKDKIEKAQCRVNGCLHRGD